MLIEISTIKGNDSPPGRKLQEFMDSPRIMDQFPNRSMPKNLQDMPKFSPELHTKLNLLATRTRHLISLLNNLGEQLAAQTTTEANVRLY